MNKILNFIFTGQDRLSPVSKKAGKNVSGDLGGMGFALGKTQLAYAALGTVITGVFGKAVSDARNLNMAPLQVAAKNAGIAWSTFGGQVQAAGGKMANLGFTQGQVNAALTKLVTATGSSSVSLDSLSAAADLARYKHISLTDASLALARAAGGNTKALKELGISTADLPKHFATTGTAADRLQFLLGMIDEKIGGQASAYATTFGGKIEVLKAKFTNLSAQIGLVLIPILSSLMNGVLGVMKWFSALPGPVKMFIGVLGTTIATSVPLLIAFSKITMAIKVLSEAAKTFGIVSKIAALGNPWFLLAAAIAIVAVLIITHWKTVMHWGSVCFSTIANVAKAAWSWIKQNWPLLLGILTGPIGVAVVMISRHWGAITDGARNTFNNVVSFVRSLPGRIVGAAGWLGNVLLQAGKDVISGLWNGMKWYWDHGPFGWLKSLAGIISKIKGPLSFDASLLVPHGKAIMGGFLKGLTKGWGAVTGFIGGVAGKIGGFFGGLFGGGGGSSSWDGVILQALAMLGQSSSWLGVVRARLMQESGGNDYAVNRWDSNWAAGTPSVGGMQVIGPTFAAYAGPFRGVGPFMYGVSVNRLANMYAGLNYALHRYGSLGALSRPGGYERGTRSARRGWAWVGETEPELVHFNGGESIGPVRGGRGGGVTYVVNVNVSGHALASKQEIGRTVSDALSEFGRKGGNVPYVKK